MLPNFIGKDVSKRIFEYSKKSCRDLTEDYSTCRPPFRYRNAVTGETRQCARDCLENLAQWLTPLLVNRPTTLEIQWRYGDLVTYPLKYEKLAVPFVEVGEKYITISFRTPSRYQAENEYFFLGIEQAVQFLQNTIIARLKVQRTIILELALPMPDALEGRGGRTESARFPGNDAWTRFASFISHRGQIDLRLDSPYL